LAHKTEKEIRAELKEALLHWDVVEYDSLRSKDGECPRLGKLSGSKVPMTRGDMGRITYQLYWNLFSPDLRHYERKAAQLRYIYHWDWGDVGSALGIKAKTAMDNSGRALTYVARRIFERQPDPMRCQRCGGKLIMEGDETTAGPEVKCLLCGRTLNDTDRDFRAEAGASRFP
jgi:ribosomal protein S27E